MTRNDDDFIDVPILSIIMCFINTLERTDITKLMPNVTSVISCTGDAVLQTVSIDPSKSTEQVVNAYAFTIRLTLGIASAAKDKKGYSINLTKIIDECTSEFPKIKTVAELKNKLNIIKEKFEAME
jgi:hypothetical protein